MRRVREPENNRSLTGSSYDLSDDDESRSFCYSPQDEDQRRRFCDLVALALASSRDYGLAQSQSASWEADESDSESHPSLESDAEAELLDLFDEEDENESSCFDESEPSTSPSVDGSFESYDATVIQNRKLLLSSRQQRQQAAAFRETNSFCTNHANLLSPDLMILVERLLKENRRTAQKEKAKGKKPKPLLNSGTTESPRCNMVLRSRSAHCEPEEKSVEMSDEAATNATVMEQLRELVYRKYENSKTSRSETESIRSSILPVTPTLLSYREALRRSSLVQNSPSEAITGSPEKRLESTICGGVSAATVPIACDSSTPCKTSSRGTSRISEQRASGPAALTNSTHSGAVLAVNESQQATASRQTVRSTNGSGIAETVMTGMVTRSKLRSLGRSLVEGNVSGKSDVRARAERSPMVSDPSLSIPESRRAPRSAVDPIDPELPNSEMSVSSAVNRGENIERLTPTALGADPISGGSQADLARSA